MGIPFGFPIFYFYICHMSKYNFNRRPVQVVQENSGGVGFFGLLTIVFIVLKLIGVIDWSWFWVLSPVLLPIILVVGIAVIWFVLVLFLRK